MLEACDAIIDISVYEQKRNILCDALQKIGYDVRRPDGTFYIWVKTPVEDDMEFCNKTLMNEGVIAVPGKGFFRSGYMRLSTTTPMDKIVGSFSGFERAFKQAMAR